MRRDDQAMSTMVGAILLLAILGTSIIYVNAYYVPKQGATREVQARDNAESEIVSLASALGAAESPTLADFALQNAAASPPLLSGIILSPVVAAGRLVFDPAVTSVTISSVAAAPAGGVPSGDPMRVDLGGGRMRVFALGNATSGASVGAIQLSLGGAYLEPASYALTGGAVLVDRATGSVLVSPPAIQLGTGTMGGASTTTVVWRVPVLSGSAGEIAGTPAAQVGLSPGLVARSGGGERVYNASITIQTSSLEAWTAALSQVVGTRGTVVATPGADPDSGSVTATILPPAGTPAGVPAVQLDLESVRFAVEINARNLG